MSSQPYYQSLMEKTPNQDPIGLQLFPLEEESNPVLPQRLLALSQEIYGRAIPWTVDPIGDVEKSPVKRLTHRYENRALLHTTSTCAVYCQFCFRKSHLQNKTEELYSGDFKEAFDYLKRNPEIKEIILTGGDPLSLSNMALQELIQNLEQIPSLKTLRIHSRTPVTLPQRINDELVKILSHSRFAQLKLMTHFNHPAELTALALTKLSLLKKTGVDLYNQCVLLKNINNSSKTLSELFHALYENGIKPVYLHHMDWAPETFYFRVPMSEGKLIYQNLKGLVPGPALPRYVVDLPHGLGKTDVELGSTLTSGADSGFEYGVYEFTSPITKSLKSTRIKYLDIAYLPLSQGH